MTKAAQEGDVVLKRSDIIHEQRGCRCAEELEGHDDHPFLPCAHQSLLQGMERYFLVTYS